MYIGKKKYTLTELLHGWLVIAMPIICIGGVSAYPNNFRYPAIIITMVFCMLYIGVANRKSLNDIIVKLFMVILGYLVVNVAYSIDVNLAIEYLIVYTCGVLLFFSRMTQATYCKILKVMRFICFVIVITIILSVFIDDFMLNYLSFFINPNHNASIIQAIHNELLYAHAYSGLAREKAEAAYIMNVGLAILFAKYFSGIKMSKMNIAEMVLLTLGLVLANKRTLFIIPIICYIIFSLLNKEKYKYLKLVITVLSVVCIFIILSTIVPEINNIYVRLFNSDNEDLLSGRGLLWSYALSMFNERPLTGYGFGSFNEFAFINGYRISGGRWDFFAHNCYLELLGETGVIFFVVFMAAMIIPLLNTIKMLRKLEIKKKDKYLLWFSFYIQILCFLYSLTGNVIYYKDQIMIWFFAIAIILYEKGNVYGGTIY